MRARHTRRISLPAGAFRSRVARRHVDLLRVSSALCPAPAPAR
ncbi:putative leader peptide [Streptantibioticus silvisoli]|uniref:Uncharacterized protein n=1 Tax=Streptantibioticus silvisoli TaxID=2705255 RepID=A0ABT6VY27_9ACTN|nr:putative leader peptide [Streptantibioticus silvisoli]MDI5963391.1 hypothetical protein [Streptantibioticus silvisoli]